MKGGDIINKTLKNYTPEVSLIHPILSTRKKSRRKRRRKIKREKIKVVNKDYSHEISPDMNKVRARVVRCVPSINVQIDKTINLNALIDTGASLNIMSKELFDKLYNKKLIISCSKWEGNVMTANNTDMEVQCECEAKIKIKDFTWKIKFLVIPEIAYDLILSAHFISRTGLILCLGERKCYFKFAPQVMINLIMDQELHNVINNVINIGCCEMQEKVMEIVNSYPEVFTDRIGKALDLEIKLEVTDNEPVNIRPYFLNPPVLLQTKAIIQEWLDQDIIEPTTSRYSSPAFLTKQGRLVVNFSLLNKKLQRIDYPLGDLQNYYQHLQGAKYFTVLDLNKSFLQCPLAPESRHLTAFSLVFAKYQFKRVPFGLSVGSSVLSSYMDRIFNDIKFKFILNFCDDIIIYSKDKVSHLEHIKEVVKRLSDHNLTVNMKKGRFFCREISFLGNVISNNKVTIDPDRTKNVREFPVPRNVKNVRQFLGMTSFFSRYIPHYAEICEPLCKLKRKRVRFDWTEECQIAYDKLKFAISNPPVLQIANFDKPFIVMSDASFYACGGVLLQHNENNDLLPIAYFSKLFDKTARNYTIYEKECLSAILCIEKWHEFLCIKPFKLITDNEALSYVLNSKRKAGFNRLSRWVERLLSLPFEVEHRGSADNCIADCLSRLYDQSVLESIVSEDMSFQSPSMNELETCSENNKPPIVCPPNDSTVAYNVSDIKENKHFLYLINEVPLALKDLKVYQSEDHECKNIVQSIKDKTNQECFYLKNEILMFKGNKGKPRIFLPSSLVDLVCKYFHNSLIGGHLGITKTQLKINEYFYRADLNQLVKTYVKNCHICNMSKSTQKKHEGTLVSAPINNAFDVLFTDLIGPLPKSKKGNNYVLVVVDGFTRFTWMIPIKNCTSKIIISQMENVIFNNFGVPKVIVSDNASYYRSSIFKRFIFKNVIEHRTIAAYHAQSNRCERFVRNISTVLRCYYQDCHTLWDQNCNYLQISLNTAVNSSTGFSAFSLMFNHKCNNCLSNVWKLNDLIGENLTMAEKKENLSKAVINVRKSVLFNSQRKKYTEPYCKHPFRIGSLVYVKTHFLSNKANKFSKKLAPRYVGLYRILYFITPVTVIVQHVKNVQDVRKIHIVDLKFYK